MNVLNDLYKPTYPIAYLSELYGSDIVIGRPGPVGRFLCTRHQVMMGGSLQLDDRRSHLSFAAELIDYVKRGQISCAATPKMVYVECRYADHATARVVCSTEDKGKMWASQASDLIKCMAIACMAIEYSEPVRKTFEEAFQLSDDLENALNAALLFCDTFKWEFVDQFPEFKEGKNIPEEELKTAYKTGFLKDVSAKYNGIPCELFDGLTVRYPAQEENMETNSIETFLSGQHKINHAWEPEQEGHIRPITFMDDYVPGDSFYKVMKKIDLRIGDHMVKNLEEGKTDPLDVRKDYVNMLFYGDPGTGKTALANAIAAVTGMPIYEVTMNEDSEDDEVEGKNKIVEGQLSFVETAFLEGFSKGGIILLEEINLARPNVFTSVLNQAMEYPYIIKKNGYERITRHPMTVIIGTMNLETEGTMALNSASSQRFTSKYLIEEMSDEEMKSALIKRGYKRKPVNYVYQQYKKLRKDLKESEQKKKLLREISIRQCIDALNAIEEGVNPREAITDSMYGAIAVKNKKVADALKAGLFDTMPDYRG
ncbi:AAA family ATPase [Clostridium porci]|uniref:AAA domain-containing protein n=1 Tax=Clostridium porci TaxID=2605778 RepID=A0A7X2NN83_9CLOT|nr:AAA family ATPase [Clostridium porci]MSS37999.1 AAA domain-containing protein [Clostridium porci]